MDHGMYCFGCCWALMALLFVGGVMNLYWIAGLAIYVAAEKFLPNARWVVPLTGGGLIAVGLYLVLESALAS
jgi:predicted metal-binding membrane protein